MSDLREKVEDRLLWVYEKGLRAAKSERKQYASEIIALVRADCEQKVIEAVKKVDYYPPYLKVTFFRNEAIEAIKQVMADGE